jgi:TonB family protein
MPRRLFALYAVLLVTSPFSLAFAQTPAATTVSEPMKIGGDVLPPVLIHSVNPKFTRALRSANVNAVVRVGLVVDTAGKPTQIHIITSSNSSLDKSAMNAVSKYRFKPATLHGQPVPVELVVEVKLDIFD